ncbi:Short-chain-enoyl-CoA hydratase [Aquicella siphonis]|uniref:Short-chain-enoyl-CoA hydratase n=1 Tax=Aquicella siphonis TaxID=254247 RepID=A0A5E4PJ37_9COXI|nr:enoyl-CoA hydratase-related protein [Aquicella siphonis]VVC76974.1 Short-chain-enoyl-CoA hydratase [Aquicella siphonis]
MEMNNDMVKIIPHDSGILQISLNRPEQLNALSREVLQRLSRVFHDARQDASIRAILLTGEGKGFCAGADIKQLVALNGQQGLEFARFGQQVFRSLEMLGKPSIAAVHGFAFGGGCELAMAATIRLAAANTNFGQPEIKLGVIPGFGGTQRLARLIGKGRALEICLTGRRFKAEEALQWGLVNEVTTSEDLVPRAMSILKEMVHLGPIALQSILSVIHSGYDLPMEEAMEMEAAHFGLCCATADKQEGVSAFIEKRTAVFTGA